MTHSAVQKLYDVDKKLIVSFGARSTAFCRNTIFGRALVNALRGGACKPENKTVSALDLFKYIHPFMQKAVERINLQSAAEYKPPTENDLQASAPPVAVYQTPVMFVPTGMRELAKNPICFKCDPPAAPDKPYVSFLT